MVYLSAIKLSLILILIQVRGVWVTLVMILLGASIESLVTIILVIIGNFSLFLHTIKWGILSIWKAHIIVKATSKARISFLSEILLVILIDIWLLMGLRRIITEVIRI